MAHPQANATSANPMANVSRPPSLTADPTLAPFLTPTFSPSAYLNANLPTWTPSSSSSSSTLQSTQSETQNLLTSLDAKLARLNAQLTQLTDEILRSGGRLGYEVEILRSDAEGLEEGLRAGLRDRSGLGRFAGAGAAEGLEIAHADTEGKGTDAEDTRAGTVAGGEEIQGRGKPEYMETLHTLTRVRGQLENVTKTFDAALSWPLPPSSLSLRNQIVSVSAPGSNGAGGVDELEAKGKAFEDRTRDEIEDLLEDEPAGVEQAVRRVQELRALCEVWKGTVEERARMSFVEQLEKMVERKRGSED